MTFRHVAVATQGPRARYRAGGFTLVETLIVLVILSVVLAAGAWGLKPDERQVLKTEGERLALLLEVAIAESRHSGELLAWSATSGRYAFLRYSEDREWVPLTGDDLLREHAMPGGTAIEDIRVDQRPIGEDGRVVLRAATGQQAFIRLRGPVNRGMVVANLASGKVDFRLEAQTARP